MIDLDRSIRAELTFRLTEAQSADAVDMIGVVVRVLDVHRPNEYTGICEECGTGMTHNLIPYHLRKPCPTVRAIAQGMRVSY